MQKEEIREPRFREIGALLGRGARILLVYDDVGDLFLSVLCADYEVAYLELVIEGARPGFTVEIPDREICYVTESLSVIDIQDYINAMGEV